MLYPRPFRLHCSVREPPPTLFLQQFSQKGGLVCLPEFFTCCRCCFFCRCSALWPILGCPATLSVFFVFPNFLRCRWKGRFLFCSISFKVISSLLLKDKSFSRLCSLVIVPAYIACGLPSPTDPSLSSFSSFLDFHLVAIFLYGSWICPIG